MRGRSSVTATRLGVVLFAALVGVLIAFIPWQVSVVLVVAAIGVLALAAVRVVAFRLGDDASERTEATPEATPDGRLRLARALYYVGAAAIGFLTIRPAAGFTVSDWVFLLSLVLVVIVTTVQDIRRDYLVPGVITVGVLLFAVGGLISTTNAADASQSLLVVIRVGYLTLVWFWLGTVLLETIGHVRNAVVAWVSSAALCSSGAVAQFFYGDVIPGGDLAYGRMTGFTPAYNNLGGLAATAFVPALMVALDSPRSWQKLVGLASTALIVAGLLLSGSVGGMLGASVATVFWLALRGVSLRLVVGIGAVAGSAFVLMTATGVTNAPSPVERINRVTSAQEAAQGTGGTLYTRLDGYREAWERIHEQPLVGVGFDEKSIENVLGTAHGVHNIILSPWLSAGILGLVGVVLMLYGAFTCGLATLRLAAARDRSLLAALLASVVCFIVFAMGEPILFVRYGWFATALLVAVRAQQVRMGLVERQRVAPRQRPVVYGSPRTS
jgi:O-antigen ligase